MRRQPLICVIALSAAILGLIAAPAAADNHETPVPTPAPAAQPAPVVQPVVAPAPAPVDAPAPTPVDTAADAAPNNTAAPAADTQPPADAPIARPRIDPRPAGTAKTLKAVIKKVNGNVDYGPDLKGPWTVAKAGDELAVGTIIRTGFKGKVTIDLQPNAQITIDRLSSVAVADLVAIDPAEGDKIIRTRLAAKYGTIKFAVKQVGFNNDFQIVRPSFVLAVKGTGGEDSDYGGEGYTNGDKGNGEGSINLSGKGGGTNLGPGDGSNNNNDPTDKTRGQQSGASIHQPFGGGGAGGGWGRNGGGNPPGGGADGGWGPGDGGDAINAFQGNQSNSNNQQQFMQEVQPQIDDRIDEDADNLPIEEDCLEALHYYYEYMDGYGEYDEEYHAYIEECHELIDACEYLEEYGDYIDSHDYDVECDT